MIIAVDFDKTLHTGDWPDIGSPMPYAIDKMQQLCVDGHFLILWTCREGQLLIDAINWMLLHSIPFNLINENHPENTARYGSNSRKINADFYIDDKQVGGLPRWDEIYEEVCLMESNYKASKDGSTSKDIG